MIDNGKNFYPIFPSAILDETIEARIVYNRLTESEIFNIANSKIKISGEHLMDVLPRMVYPDKGFIHISFDKLDKSLVYELFESNKFKLSCKKDIENMIKNGDIVMVYSEKYKIPTSIPFLVKDSIPPTVYVNISDFVKMDDFGKVKVEQIRNYNALMAILFAAAIAFTIVKSKYVFNSTELDGLTLMYGGMFEKVVNGIVHLDPIMRDKVKYLATKFCLIQMYGTKLGGDIFERIKGKYFPNLGRIIMDSIDANFKIDAFDKLSLFIDELKDNYPSLKNLNLTNFFDKWIKIFGASTAMSIDYLGYHIYTLCELLLESPLVTRVTLEQTLNPSLGTSVYGGLQEFVSRNR